jgi:hypothetical protein
MLCYNAVLPYCVAMLCYHIMAILCDHAVLPYCVAMP